MTLYIKIIDKNNILFIRIHFNYLILIEVVSFCSTSDIFQANGPTWEVPLGRRDSLTANKTLANENLPGPNSTVDQLIASFGKQNLNVTDLVALSGMNIFNT